MMKTQIFMIVLFFSTLSSYCYKKNIDDSVEISLKGNTILSSSLIQLIKNNKIRNKKSRINSLNLKREDEKAIVIYFDSSSIFAGFSGDDKPTVVFPNLIGKPKANFLFGGKTDPKVGDDVMEYFSLLVVSNPIERAEINWEYMEEVFKYTFSKALNVSPKNRNIIVSFSSFYNDKFTLIDNMFQDFDISSLYVVDKSILSLYATNRQTGLVFHSEEDLTLIVPIHEGKIINDAVIKIDIGKKDVVYRLSRELLKFNFYSTNYKQRLILYDILDKLAYVAIDFEKEKDSYELSDYELPDGETITLGLEKYSAVEILFNPSIGFLENISVQNAIIQSISKCDNKIRNILYENIVISGQNTNYPGFKQRLIKELKLANSKTKIEIVDNQQREILPWIGGSTAYSQKLLEKFKITKEVYDINGGRNIK